MGSNASKSKSKPNKYAINPQWSVQEANPPAETKVSAFQRHSFKKRSLKKTYSENSYTSSVLTEDEDKDNKRLSISERWIAVATHSYQAMGDTDISFSKGDKFEVLEHPDRGWWKVRNLQTAEEGYIPCNYVEEEMSIESEDWYFGKLSRQECNRYLMEEKNPPGTFLVRLSERCGGLTLSIKSCEDRRREDCIWHYNMLTTSSGNFYIKGGNSTFASPKALIDHYRADVGLCHLLTLPCPRPKPQLLDLSPETQNKWEINCTREISKLEKIGGGNFGEVWLGLWRGKEVAIKCMKPYSNKGEFLEEALIMKTLRHNHLVTLFAICPHDKHFCIVQEYMTKGSLLSFLQDPKERDQLFFVEMLYIAEQVADGMDYLENQNLIHRDLAARNVLMGENLLAKICDFGLARLLDDDEAYRSTRDVMIPIKWTAPEAFEDHIFSAKSDVWSYGILLMEIFTFGETPYQGWGLGKTISSIKSGYRMPKPFGMSDELYVMIRKCWHVLPAKRPTFKDLKFFLEEASYQMLRVE